MAAIAPGTVKSLVEDAHQTIVSEVARLRIKKWMRATWDIAITVGIVCVWAQMANDLSHKSQPLWRQSWHLQPMKTSKH